MYKCTYGQSASDPPTSNRYWSLKCRLPCPLGCGCCGGISIDFQSAVAGFWLILLSFMNNPSVFQWFSLFTIMLIEFYWCSSIYEDFHWFSMILTNAHLFSWISSDFHTLLLTCADFQVNPFNPLGLGWASCGLAAYIYTYISARRFGIYRGPLAILRCRLAAGSHEYIYIYIYIHTYARFNDSIIEGIIEIWFANMHSW